LLRTLAILPNSAQKESMKFIIYPMKYFAILFAFVASFGEIMSAHATDNGIVTVSTHRTVDQAADKLASLIEAKHLVLFARINFAADAERAGLAMPPSQLLLFGNPRGGTPLMQAVPVLALDLPLKVLVWQDGDGHVSLSYNATTYLQARYGASEVLMKAIDGVGALVQAAAAD
jgi:uncharacterized protein (DUF302 family)